MLTRPTVPALLALLGRVVAENAGAEPGDASPNDLGVTAQLLQSASQRAAHEPVFIPEEIELNIAAGNAAIDAGLDADGLIAEALTVIESRLQLGGAAAVDHVAYALSSEVLCLVVDATFATPGPAREAMREALDLRVAHQSQIVGEYTLTGR